MECTSKYCEKTHSQIPMFLDHESACDALSTSESCTTENGHVIQTDDNEQIWKKSMIIQPKDPNQLKVFIVKRINDPESLEITLNMIKILNTYKTLVFVEEPCLDEIKEKSSGSEISYVEYKEEEEQNIDLLLVIGGDGSILWALQYFHNRVSPPILAFSKGTVNYLCNFSIHNYEKSLKNIMDSIFALNAINIEVRSRIHSELFDHSTNEKKKIAALNEVSIDRGSNSQIVKLNCYLEGRYFTTFEGDGVLIATPTGSTAYQLSAGGPILSHLMNNVVITSLSPLALSARPVVLPSSVKLTLRLAPESRKNAFFGVDGQMKLEVTKDIEILVTGSKNNAIFILGEEQDALDNWITRLHDLLGWNKRFERE